VHVCGVAYLCMCRAGQNRIDRVFDDIPAKNTVYTPYIYGSGQPCACVCTCVWLCACHGAIYFAHALGLPFKRTDLY
jgi:hypothetical protein